MMRDQTSEAAIERAADLMQRARSALGLARARDPLVGFRIADAIQFALSGRSSTEHPIAAFFDEEFQRAGHKPTSRHSAFIPAAAIARALQGYQTTVATAGQELVETTLDPSTFVDALRPRSVALSLGAQTITGLVGDVQIPRQSTTSTAYWTSTTGTSPVVSGAITESEATFDATPLVVKPGQLGVYGTASRLFIRQGGQLAERVLANDVASTLGTAIDQAVITGSGTSGQPLGIVNTAGIGAVSGATFALSTVTASELAVANANALVNPRTAGWATTPTVAALLAGRNKVPTYSYSPLWAGSVNRGTINGTTALSTTNAPASTAVYGDWSQAMLLQWGENAPIELEFSQFGSGFAAGDVAFRAIISANVVIRHPLSFVAVSAIT